MNNSIKQSFTNTEDLVARAHRRATGEELGVIRINLLIKHCSCLIADAMSDLLKPYGLCYKSYLIMVMMYSRDDAINPSELCDSMGETRSNMTRLCDELVSRNLAQRVTNASDRRRIDLSLTDQGLVLIQKVLPLLRERIKQIYALLGDTLRNQLEEGLQGLLLAVEDSRRAWNHED